MKKLIALTLASAMMISGPVFADGKATQNAQKPTAEQGKDAAKAPMPKPTKIGVLDIRKIMGESKEVKDSQAALQAEFKPKVEEIQAMEKGFRENIEKLQRNRDVMSEQERAKLEKEIQATQQELARLQESFSKETNAKQQQVMQKFFDKVTKEVDAYAKEKEYDMILLADAVPYMTNKFEITEDIAKRISER